MIKRGIVLALMFLLSGAAVAGATLKDVRALAGSCSLKPINGCDIDVSGTLESGDCAFSTGNRFDMFEIQGVKGQTLEIIVRALSPSYTSPLLILAPPSFDSVDPPAVAGGAGGATLRYTLTSSGPWSIAVGTADLFGAGDYVLHVYCYDNTPGVPLGCVAQDLLCGQTAVWSLNADSCRFNSAPRAYTIWYIYAVAGDVLRFEQTAVGFEPLAGLYTDDDGTLVASSTRENTRKHRLQYSVLQTRSEASPPRCDRISSLSPHQLRTRSLLRRSLHLSDLYWISTTRAAVGQVNPSS